MTFNGAFDSPLDNWVDPKMTQFKLVFPDSAEFHAGQLVTGKVLVSLNKPKKCKGKVSWSTLHRNMFFSLHQLPLSPSREKIASSVNMAPLPHIYDSFLM